MKRLILALLVVLLVFAIAGSVLAMDRFILLRPGEQATVICDKNLPANVQIIRGGGAIITCAEE